jgi:hypothetical protein
MRKQITQQLENHEQGLNVSLQYEIYFVTICRMIYYNSSCSVVDIMFNAVIKPPYEVII